MKERVKNEKGDYAASTIYGFETDLDGVHVYRGIHVKNAKGFKKKFYDSYTEMIDEIMNEADKLDRKDFYERVETAAHEAFHELEMYKNLDQMAGQTLSGAGQELSEAEEEGYVSDSLAKAELEIEMLAENYRRQTIQTKGYEISDKLYTNYIEPAMKIVNNMEYGPLIKHASEFLNSIGFLSSYR